MGDLVDLRFLIDEGVPCSTTRVLRDAGFDVLNVHAGVLNAVHEVGESLLHHLAIVEIGKVRLRG